MKRDRKIEERGDSGRGRNERSSKNFVLDRNELLSANRTSRRVAMKVVVNEETEMNDVFGHSTRKVEDSEFVA